jgi:hypothetical protein
MPRYKVLKGVAHNIGHSFTSLMNYSVDDYSMGHILRFARESRQTTLIIDFLKGEGSPAVLLREPIAELPRSYTNMFWRMVASSGSDRALVQSAVLTLTFDLDRTQPGPRADCPQSPYTCDVTILDCRGKRYTSHFRGWWYVERGILVHASRRWWNPITWF